MSTLLPRKPLPGASNNGRPPKALPSDRTRNGPMRWPHWNVKLVPRQALSPPVPDQKGVHRQRLSRQRRRRLRLQPTSIPTPLISRTRTWRVNPVLYDRGGTLGYLRNVIPLASPSHFFCLPAECTHSLLSSLSSRISISRFNGESHFRFSTVEQSVCKVQFPTGLISLGHPPTKMIPV